MNRVKLTIAFLLLPILLLAQGVPIKSGAATDLATVDTNKNIRVSEGASTRPTYVVSLSAQATTAAMALQIEAAAGTGFKLVGFCWDTSNATAAAAVTISVQRRTTAASSGGTACTNEGTTISGAGCNISKMDPADANYTGIARNGGTPGTAGAVIDQLGHQAGIVATGAGGTPPQCQWYGSAGSSWKMPVVAAGVTNGLTITVSAAGAGGIASGALSAYIIAE